MKRAAYSMILFCSILLTNLVSADIIAPNPIEIVSDEPVTFGITFGVIAMVIIVSVIILRRIRNPKEVNLKSKK